jgi:hypothetical protein
LEFNMKKLLVITITAVLIFGIFGIVQPDSHATKSITKQAQQSSDNATIRPERQFQQQPEAPGATTTQPEQQQSQQPSEAPESTTIRPERQFQQQPEAPEDGSESQRQAQAEEELANAAEQQENENVDESKDEQNGDEQQDEDDDENNDDNDEEQVVIDKAPIAITGDNVYVAWWTNETGNDEVMFRASTDAGQTFGDTINLSNTTDANSTRAEIDSDADSVMVTWWETNQTSDMPVMRVSNDNGETFGPSLQLSTNGTIGQATEEEE